MAQIKITITIEATLMRDAHAAVDAMDAKLRESGGRVVKARLTRELDDRITEHWPADLDECADCGGSTAEGTPDPHECPSNDAVAAAGLATALAALPAYNGWRAHWEYPGFLAFHRKGSPSVLATPDYHARGMIACEVQYDGGRTIPFDSIAWPRDGRTPEGYMALLRPVLDKIARPVWLEVGYGLATLRTPDVAGWELVGHCAKGHEMRRDPMNPDHAVDLGCDAELELHTDELLDSIESAPAPRRLLVVTYDVTGMTEEQIAALTTEAVVQGEASDDHPTAKVTTEVRS